MTSDTLPEGLRILLVEDEAIIAMTAEDMLEELGCVVTQQASTLEEAMEAAETGNFDVALLDINLNGTMSMPVAHALKSRQMPFVFTTGYGNAGSEGEFGDVVVVAKPYTLATLSAAISECLTQASG